MLAKSAAAQRIDPRTRRTRQLLMDAFGKLVAEKTFEEITVQDITERATVNRATFYAHFEDKYVLAQEALHEWVKNALAKNLPPDAKFSPANLQLLIQTLCEFLVNLHSHCATSNRKQFDSLLEEQVKQQIYDMLLRWLREIHPPRSANPAQMELQATMSSWAMYGAALRWSNGDRKQSAEQFARSALPMFLAGMETPALSTARVATMARARA